MRIITKDRSFYKTLIALTIPIVLQGIISYAVNFADHLMVGRLGDLAVSGVFMGERFQTILQMFVFGIDAAMLILSAQYWGAEDKDSVKKISAMGIRWSFYVGAIMGIIIALAPRFFTGLLTDDAAVVETAVGYVVFVALSYPFFCASQLLITAMKSVENAKLGFWISFIALFVNIGLNYLFIFGGLGIPAMGATGAGLATLISRIVEFLIAAVFVFKIDTRLGMKLSDMFTQAPELRRDFLINGAPVVGGQMVWAVNLVFNAYVMGHLSAAAVTASSITDQLEGFLRVFVFGLSGALGIITSKTVGAGEFDKMKEYARTAEVIFLGVGLTASALMYLFHVPFMSLYEVSDEALMHCRQFFNVLFFTFIGTCWQATTLSGLVKSGGDTSFVLKNDSFFVFLVMIPGSLLAIHFGAPAWVIFFVLKCDQILKCFVAFFKVNSFNWMRKLTRAKEA